MGTSKFGREFKDRIRLINDILLLTNRLAKQLEANVGHHEFVPTAIEFARINAEAPQSITLLAREGNLAQAHVLMRWYLEMSHLLLYLWESPDKFVKWKSGLGIRPKEVGKFFDRVNIPSWRETYEDWSNVVHGNKEFIENCAVIAKMTPKTETQVMVVGSILMNVAFISLKTNDFLSRVLPEMESESVRVSFDEIGPRLQLILDEQLAAERRLMAEE